MLKGVNDSLAEARDLVKLLRGVPAKINLIPVQSHGQAARMNARTGRRLKPLPKSSIAPVMPAPFAPQEAVISLPHADSCAQKALKSLPLKSAARRLNKRSSASLARRTHSPHSPQIPAQAGIQGPIPPSVSVTAFRPWTPACAGVSGIRRTRAQLSSRVSNKVQDL